MNYIKLDKHNCKAISEELDRLHLRLSEMIKNNSYYQDDFIFVKDRIIKLQDMLYPTLILDTNE